ncbi:LOW QUALITY PROTEIN: zinc finger protein 862-like, partial [Sipha flava]|uniref:LOW QUALITY PROTEIN: zinc finger protein 862-like n=1 Tax=Sipha flava TaxID=143950 RepID=A0A8B8GKK1_9HEMI
LSTSEININAPFNKLVSKQNEKLALKIGKFMIEVFNDAKRGTLSAWSWPSREVVQIKKSQLNLLEPPKKIDIKEGDLQYINPTTHNELLNSIVETDKPLLMNKLKTALAISLRVDGSVDRTQVDNIHVLAKIITTNGDSELVFIGFKEPIQKRAIGYYEVIKSLIRELMSFEDFLSILSSIATDGASVNIGQKNGLWALIDSNRCSNNIQGPLLKMWCAVHRSALAWGQLTSNVIEVHKLIVACSGMSSYFHQSGLRTKELKDIANEEGMSFIQLPKYFEVRWTEFTYNLLLGILKNWRILVKYFLKKKSENNDVKSEGFYKILTDYDKMMLLCFLTDLGYLYGRFQKQIQTDDVLIFDIETKKNTVVQMIENLKVSPLLGGWEYEFNKNTIVTHNSEFEKNIIKLHNIELFDKNQQSRRKKHNLYVSDKRSFLAIRNDVIEHIVNYLNTRLDSSEWLPLKVLEKVSDAVSDEELQKAHQVICPDFELADFVTSYKEAAGISSIKDKQLSSDLLKSLLSNDSWKPLSTAVARILSAKPHSADVERLISYYNLLKTATRSSLSPTVINDSLYVKINMPALDEFDPQPAVFNWLNKKKRHSKMHTHAKKQEWYQGVFDEVKEKYDLTNNIELGKIQF